MSEKIYTIPVNEAFEACAEDKSRGCPFCRLYNKLEADETDLILGRVDDGAGRQNKDQRKRLLRDAFSDAAFGEKPSRAGAYA